MGSLALRTWGRVAAANYAAVCGSFCKGLLSGWKVRGCTFGKLRVEHGAARSSVLYVPGVPEDAVSRHVGVTPAHGSQPDCHFSKSSAPIQLTKREAPGKSCDCNGTESSRRPTLRRTPKPAPELCRWKSKLQLSSRAGNPSLFPPRTVVTYKILAVSTLQSGLPGWNDEEKSGGLPLPSSPQPACSPGPRLPRDVRKEDWRWRHQPLGTICEIGFDKGKSTKSLPARTTGPRQS